MTDVKNIDGDLTARGTRFGITVARFNSFISERLLEGALDALTRHGADAANIEVVRVPGAFEMPLVLKAMAESKKIRRAHRARLRHPRRDAALRIRRRRVQPRRVSSGQHAVQPSDRLSVC